MNAKMEEELFLLRGIRVPELVTEISWLMSLFPYKILQHMIPVFLPVCQCEDGERAVSANLSNILVLSMSSSNVTETSWWRPLSPFNML